MVISPGLYEAVISYVMAVIAARDFQSVFLCLFPVRSSDQVMLCFNWPAAKQAIFVIFSNYSFFHISLAHPALWMV